MEPIIKEPKQEDGALQKQFVLNGLRMIHGPEMRDEVVQKLGQGDPAEAIAKTAALTLAKLEATAEEQGTPLDDQTKLMGGYELIGELIEVGLHAGVFEQMNEDQRQELQVTALTHVLSQVLARDISSGKINPQELLQASQEAQQKMGLDMEEGERKLQGAMA